VCSNTKEGFLFGGLSPPNEKTFLCALGDSAVKFLFWTRMIRMRNFAEGVRRYLFQGCFGSCVMNERDLSKFIKGQARKAVCEEKLIFSIMSP
jgi:hypothetical protein